MKKYKILPHPAELRLKVYGKTMEELFINAAEAMANILAASGTNQVIESERKKTGIKKEIIKIQSVDINSLLVDFLSEILAKSQINKQVYKVIKLKINKEKNFLKAEIIGSPLKRFNEDIKAVTYEDLEIKQINGVCQTYLVFDI